MFSIRAASDTNVRTDNAPTDTASELRYAILTSTRSPEPAYLRNDVTLNVELLKIKITV